MPDADPPLSRTDLVDAILERVHAHPGSKRRMELDAFFTSVVHVFRGNYLEVVGLVDQASSDLDLAMELVQNVRKPVVRDEFMGVLTRALHNYLASTTSMIDHSRRLVRVCDSRFRADWRQRCRVAASAHPVMQFMTGLRNYSLHRRLPFFGTSVSIRDPRSPQHNFECEIALSADDLLEWERWPAPDRAFIIDRGPSLVVRPLVVEHSTALYDLNVWLHAQLMTQNIPALEQANQLRLEYNAALLGVDLDTARERTAQWFQEKHDDRPATDR